MDYRHRSKTAGFTITELLLVVAVAATLAGITMPLASDSLDDLRTGMGARYLAARIRSARMDAIKRGAAVGLKFEPGTVDYAFTPYADGNGNGVRTSDVSRGMDTAVSAPERLSDNFPAVHFGLLPGLRDADGEASGTEGVRVGSARILTLSPDGTATAGTLYVHGRRAQYAVRVLGSTGRTRVLKYNTGDRTWITR
jgi:Tfp pilus assembly protein FimT